VRLSVSHLLPNGKEGCCYFAVSNFLSAVILATPVICNITFAPFAQFYLKPWVICLMGGLLPFGSIFIEMYFIFTSFWNYKVRSCAAQAGLDGSGSRGKPSAPREPQCL